MLVTRNVTAAKHMIVVCFVCAFEAVVPVLVLSRQLLGEPYTVCETNS